MEETVFNAMCIFFVTEAPVKFINAMWILFVTEALVEFIKPLKDIQIMEKTKVVLECEVSKPNLIATWYVDGEEIKSSDRVELVVYDTVHQLIIETAKLTDEGKYTIDVEGQKSSATLLVDGKSLLFINLDFI